MGLGLLVVATLVLGIVFGRGGEPTTLPAPIESVTPGPNDRALAQAVIEIDLEAGYLAQVFVDGFPVPENEVIFIEATGVHRWQPSPTSLIFDTWTPGEHSIRIAWDTTAGLPQPGEFTWTFRIQ